MEVLQGRQSGPSRSRRRLDSLRFGENRALDWSRLPSDIELESQSPRILANLLARPDGGSLVLLPSDETAPFDTNGDPSVQGLQTRHDASELLQRCKRILVENALIKDKGDRQLYLAVGFISWPDAREPSLRQRAPLLLFPALMVRIPDQQRYEIRLHADSVEYNQALISHAEQRHGVTLPEQGSEHALAGFLDAVQAAIQNAPSLALERQMALGSASLVHGDAARPRRIRLPDLPPRFDLSLAMSITGNKRLEQLVSVLQLIPDYPPAQTEARQARSTADATANRIQRSPTAPSPSRGSVASLRQYAARLAAEGLDHVEFRQLDRLPERIGKWIRSVTKGLESHCVQDILAVPELSARELVRLSGIIELIDKAPLDIEQYAHGDLCFASSTALLRRAQHQARLIEDEMSALQQFFVMDKVPGKTQLLSLMSELAESIEHDPELVDADYFHARRQFMEFSRDKPAHLTIEHRQRLQQLAKVLRFRELFVNNTEYRAALGPGYRGLRTDWEQLNQAADFARELASVLGSASMASRILSQWARFRTGYGVELNTLSNAGEACRRLLGVVGTRWQSQSVKSLLLHGQVIASRLVEWHCNHGGMENHADKTPAMVLSSFSGRSLDDMVIENQVDETRIRIDHLLQEGQIDRAQVSDTLSWLRHASQLAAANQQDIDAIVEHLQIS